MEYIKVMPKDLVVGEIYNDIPPDSKRMDPMNLKFIKIDTDIQTIYFKNFSDHSNNYIENSEGLIPFELDENPFYQIIEK